MNKTRLVNRYVGLSVLLHTLICAILFLAIIHKQLPLASHIQPLIKPENIPAPVIFAKQPEEEKKAPDTAPLDIDPPGMPKGLAISMSQLPDESLLANKKPGLTHEKEESTTTIKRETTAINPVAKPEPQQPNIAHKDSSKTPSLSKKEPQENPTDNVIHKKSDTGIPVPKELTIADLFKNAQKSFAQEEKVLASQDAGGPSGDIVISEGSLKYYSLWSKFLHHLNNAARFNRRGGQDAQVHAWLQSGLIKKEALFAIDVDKKGHVVNVALLSSSGHTPFDKLCISDIWSATPYPPLPDSINRPTARFQVKAFF